MIKYTFFILACLLLLACKNLNSEKRVTEKSENSSNNKLEKDCINKREPIYFFIDEFSSEGAEGNLYFRNDTIIDKIEFGFATSMKFVEQEYIFENNRLARFEQKINYLTQDKNSYISIDSIKIKGRVKILKNINFEKGLFKKLINIAEDENSCFKLK